MDSKSEAIMSGESTSSGVHQLQIRYNGGCNRIVDYGRYDGTRSPETDADDYCRMQPLSMVINSTDDDVTDRVFDTRRQMSSERDEHGIRPYSTPHDFEQRISPDHARRELSVYAHNRVQLPVENGRADDLIETAERMQVEVERYYTGMVSDGAGPDGDMCCNGVDYGDLVGGRFHADSYQHGQQSYSSVSSAKQHHLGHHIISHAPALSIVGSDKMQLYQPLAPSDDRFHQLFPVIDEHYSAAAAAIHQHQQQQQYEEDEPVSRGAAERNGGVYAMLSATTSDSGGLLIGSTATPMRHHHHQQQHHQQISSFYQTIASSSSLPTFSPSSSTLLPSHFLLPYAAAHHNGEPAGFISPAKFDVKTTAMLLPEPPPASAHHRLAVADLQPSSASAGSRAQHLQLQGSGVYTPPQIGTSLQNYHRSPIEADLRRSSVSGSSVEPEMDEINTRQVAARVTAELKRYSVPQAVFAHLVLCRSQGTLSDLLRNPKPWSKLKSGRETFRRMWKWLQEPEYQRMASLRLVGRITVTRRRDPSTALPDDDRLPPSGHNQHYFATANQHPTSSTPNQQTRHQPQHPLLQHQPQQQLEQQRPGRVGKGAAAVGTSKKPRLVFTDIQRRTLLAIFGETRRPNKEMQAMIAEQLGLKVSTVANFFMNARRRSTDKYIDDDEPAGMSVTVGGGHKTDGITV